MFRNLASTRVIATLAMMLASSATSFVRSEDAPRSRENLNEPVLRVAKATAPKTQTHPLDPALDMARTGLETVRTAMKDYTATLVKRERIDGELGDYEYMFVKVRNRRVDAGQVVAPFSVYMYFLKPEGVKGREVMYVEGQNNDKMVAHEGGLSGKYLPTVWLKPSGVIAMRGQRYPITDIGIENLVIKLIERAERDRSNGNHNCDVSFHENAKINGRVCTLLQVKYPEPEASLDFHLAQIFIDDEHKVPIRYAAYDFPAKEGGKPRVLEEYTYLNLKVNVGLTDKDFDHNNTDYSFH